MEATASTLPRSAADIPIEVYSQPGQFDRDGTAKPTMDAGTAGPSPPHAMCVVCQQVIECHATVKRLVCTHVCHADCADRWLRGELHCPLCKNQVLFPMALPTIHSGVVPPTRVEGSPTAMRAVPIDGTNARDYGICRDCQQVFYRNPRIIRPETNAYYRCPNCRTFDVVDMLRASCVVQ